MRKLAGSLCQMSPKDLAACERALVSGARAQHAGTRQQLRAAARRFVRRHRRDVGHLRWMLLSAVANSALAVNPMGLGASPVHAKVTLLSPPLTAAANPLSGEDVGPFSAPAIGDLGLRLRSRRPDIPGFVQRGAGCRLS